MKYTYRFFSFFFLVSLATTLKAAVPVIDSLLESQTYWVDEDFNYTITATESPTLFLEGGLQALGGTLSLNSTSGEITGAPGNAGVFELAIAAENLDGQSPVAKIDVVVVSTALTSPSSANGIVGEAISDYVITTDSSVAVTYNDSGSLPPGLARVDNIISGTPTLAGVYPVTLSASDSNGSGEIVVTFTITDPVPAITSSLQEEIILGDAFNYTITATESPTGFSATGLLELGPFAVFLNSTTGVISGTPTNTGDFDISITATNSVGSSQPSTLNLVVHSGFITSSNTTSGVVDSPFTPFEITTFNDEGLAFSNDDDLPPGLTRVDNIISGTPTLAGTYPVTISAASLGNYGDQVLTITVTDPAPEITSSLVDQNILAGELYAGYQITGTYSPTGFSATGLAAVGGMNFDAVTGTISGIPVNSGSFPITIRAENVPAGFGNPATFNLVVSPTVITSPSLTTGEVGAPFTYDITTAGTSPLAYGVQGSLPPGLSRSGTTISGTPTQAGIYTVTLSASNLDGTGSLSVTFEITDPAPVIDSSLVAQTIFLNDLFSYTITATNNPTGFSANGLDLIGGLVLDPVTGVISGIPSNEGDFVIQIGSANDAGTSPLEDLNLVVKAAIFSSSDSAVGTIGVPFSYAITTTSTLAAPVSVTGLSQIPGLSVDSSGVISGTPTDFGIYDITLIATSENGASDTFDVTVTINKADGSAPIPVITSANSILLYEGDSIDYRIQADGNPATYEVFGLGSLGLTLDSSTGQITGTPLLTGNFYLSTRATNGAGTGSEIVQLTIVPDIDPEVSITSPVSGNAITAGDNVEILINSTDSDGFITQVELFLDSVSQGFANPTGVAGQYRYNLSTNVGNVGTFTLEAISTDDRGNQITSSAVSLIVTPGSVPEVSIMTPAIGASQVINQAFEIRVSATDNDGFVAGVRLSDVRFAREPSTTNAATGAVTQGAVIEATRSFNGVLMSPSSVPGEFVYFADISNTDIVDLVATAFDDSGNEVSSIPVQFFITDGTPPTVSIDSPTMGSVVSKGSSIPIIITASDTDGTIDTIEVFNGAISLGFAELLGGLNKYRLDYQANSPGEVYLQAYATDDRGTVAVSSIETFTVVTGGLPTASITSPTTGSTSVAGNSVDILVNAADADGFITQVNIYDGGNLLGEATPTGATSQYRFIFTPDTINLGTLNLEARVVDNDGNITPSSTVDLIVTRGSIPSVSIMSPNTGDTVPVNIPVEVRVSATDADGDITSVILLDTNFVYTNSVVNTIVGTGVGGNWYFNNETNSSNTTRYRSYYNNVMQPSSVPGEYVFTTSFPNPDIVDLVAIAIDDAGNEVASLPVQFTLAPGALPSATIISPVAGGNSPYTIGDTIAIDITAEDPDGSVTLVRVYNGANPLGVASRTGNNTFRLNYTAGAVGTLNLQARVTDDSGNTSVSAIEAITVETGVLPVVAIDELNSVSDGDSITAGDNVEILVNATHANGFVTQVNVYDGNTLLGQADSTGVDGQYRYNLSTDFSNIGILSLEARATDDRGNLVSSSAVNLNVIPGSVPSVSIDSPSDGFTTQVGVPFEIRVSASDADGSIAQLLLVDSNYFREPGTFEDGVFTPGAVIESTLSFGSDGNGDGIIESGTLMQESSVAGEYVYTATLSNPDIVDLVAVALDNAGNQVTSLPVQFTVTSGNAPTVAITSPINGGDSPYSIGDTIPIVITAQDADGSVSSVEVYNGSALLGTAVRIGNSTFRLNYSANSVGSFNLQARVTDDSGITSVSSTETISVAVTPPLASDLQASRTALNVSQNVELSVLASSVDQAISSVIFKANGEVIGLSDTPTTQKGSNTSDLYILNWKPDTVGIFELSVEVQDSNSILTSLSGPTITVTAFDPLSNDENFVTDVFLRLFNRAPTDAQLEEGLSALDGSIASKASYVSSLLDSAAAEQVRDAITIYRTITGEWPSSSELINATASLLGTAAVTESITGEFALGDSLFYSESVNLSREFLADTNVTATLTVDSISPYSNLIVRRPNGTLVASDFSFGESPNVNFITSTSGTYSFEFYEYLPDSANSYTLAIDSISASGTSNPKALVDALMPEYTLNFGTFEISADNISQLFYNKHGTYPNTVNLVRLFTVFSDSTDINDTIGRFALDDNKTSTFVGINGMPLSDLYSYEIPNDMTAGKKVALASSVFLDGAPSDQDVADYSSMLLEQALEEIILEAYTSVPSALSGATSLGSDWYDSSWFGMFAYPADSTNWIYSWRLGWVYVADSGTPSGAWLYSSNLGAWLWSSSEINGYYYQAGRNTWVYMLPEGADSPGAWLYYMDENQWEFVTP